jgi:tetratricopeptide (TPR) repeat protein
MSTLASVHRGTRGSVEELAIDGAWQMVRRARELLGQGRNKDAADLLRSLLAAPRLASSDAGDELPRITALASSLLGQAIWTNGDVQDAQQAFADAIAIYEGLQELTAEEWAAFASALHGIGELDQAIDAQRAAVNTGAAGIADGLRLVRWLSETHQVGEAEARLRGLVAQYPTDPEPAMVLADMLDASGASDAGDALTDAGIRLLQAGRLEQSFDYLNRARQWIPSSPEIASAKGVVLAGLGRVKEAEEEFDHAIGLGGDEPELRIRKAAVFAGTGHPAAALAELEQAHLVGEASLEVAAVRGYVHYMDYDFEAAEPDLRRACKTNPTSPYLHMLLGDTLRRLGRDKEAIVELDRALELDPKFIEVRRIRGETLLALGRLDEAVEDLREAVAQAPDSAAIWAVLGEAQRRRGKLDAAAGALDRALELNPDDAWAVWTRGRVLSRQRKLSEAVTHFERALELDGTFAPAAASLGRVLVRLGRHNEALAAFGRALASRQSADPKLPVLNAGQRARVLISKAFVLEDLGDYQEAVKVRREAATLTPDDADLHAGLADDLRIIGQPEEALKAADHALGLEKRHAVALAIKGATLVALHRYDEAVWALEFATRLRSGYTWALTTLGDLYNRRGRLEKAGKAFSAAVAANPESLEAQRGLGDILRQQGKFDAAYAALEIALVLDPTDRLTHRVLGYTLLAADRPDDALTTFQRALEITPDDPVILGDIVQVLLAKDDYDGALELSIKAVKVGRGSAPALVARGAALCKVGDFEEAATILRAAVESQQSAVGAQIWLAWALRKQGCAYLDEAEKALRAAIKVYDHVGYRKDLATVLWLRGDPAAAKEFTLVLRKLGDEGGANADDLAMAGWCLYGLGRFNEAIRKYRRSLRIAPGSVEVLFDLALAVLCNERGVAAREDYGRAASRADRKPLLRRRGLLRVALVDLEDAQRVRGLDGDAVVACRQFLEDTLRQVEEEEEVILEMQATGNGPSSTEAAVTA